MTLVGQLSLWDISPATVPDSLYLTAEETYYLSGPIIYHPGGWGTESLVPPLVPQARLALIQQGEKEMATLEEALVYYASASMTHPLLGEDANILFWLTQEVFASNGLRQNEEPIWQALGLLEPPTLSEYQRNRLDSLRRDIRAAVVKNARAKAKRNHDHR